MKFIKTKTQLINENKLWYKTIPQFLSWLDSKSDKTFIVVDTETTGLLGPKLDQLTQVSGIATKYNFATNKFSEVDNFNKKIRLSADTKSKYNSPTSRVKKVLSFNHYGQKGVKYYDEEQVLDEFYDWVNSFDNPILVIQNAQFDMRMINVRSKNRLENEVLDTKDMLQLYYLPSLLKLAETDSSFKVVVDKIGTSDRDNGLISSSMGKIGTALGLNMNNYHDALTDCRITLEMFKAMVDFLKSHSDLDISRYQLQRIKTK